MAPIAATMALSHIEGVSDAARARELYKYYQPNSLDVAASKTDLVNENTTTHEDLSSLDDINVRSNVSTSKRSSPDTCLTAFSQLVSWRLGVQRSMISLIDAETQYFVAESTKTLDLNDPGRHGPGDDLWIGCGSVDKAGRLCERTIGISADPTGEYSAFVVNDLREDERFNQLPFVTEAPFLKFYAGVPLVTKRGIPIGSLFVVDDRVRNGLTKDEVHFMGTVASTIMRHMEMVREVEEHRRGMKMSRGLASFVEGRSQLEEDEVDTGDQEGARVAGQFETETTTLKSKPNSVRGSRAGSMNGSLKSLERKEKEYSKTLLKTEESIMSSTSKDETNLTPEKREAVESSRVSRDGIGMSAPSTQTEGTGLNTQATGLDDLSEDSALNLLFSRAANLIREAFEVDGGSVFYDAQKGFSSEFSKENQPEDSNTSEEDFSISPDPNTYAKDFAQSGQPEQPTLLPPRRTSTFQRTTIASEKAVEILGFSTPSASSIHGDEPPGSHSFSAMDEESLHRLMRRYPRGKLWTFDDHGYVSSSEDESILKSKKPNRNTTPSNRLKKQTRTAMEATLILKHFPGIRQMLFVPLWDASRSRWLSGNFTWSNEHTRILTKQGELAFLTAFGNSVMAECNRLDTETADQKKGDFIGSISHELRSPLHGILASAEFLGEEVSEGFSKGLVETIDSCGRTLLDTINHILDFSKINHFEKNWLRSRRAGSTISRNMQRDLASQGADLPMINLYATIDVSIVCEEVVESVFAGHVFQNGTAPSFDLVAEPRGKIADTRKYQSSNLESESLLAVNQNPELEVIIDIDYEDYHFTTQPGAFRRVIMNLLGNALKYTSKGYVRVKLDVSEMEDLHTGANEAVARSCINLTITDTGKGISAEFLRSKLFTAFAQENSLSSGTGLGLSIVRSIVALLEGEIQVKSNVGQGTEVKVTLPLLRILPQSTASSGSTAKSISSIPRELEELIVQLRARAHGKAVSLYGFDVPTANPLINQANQLLKASVQNFLTNWYGFTVIPYGEQCDIIIANEVDSTAIAKLTRPRSLERRPPVVLSLCSHSSRFDRAHAIKESDKVGILAKPIGPLKFARALGQCLDGVPVTTTPSLESGPTIQGTPAETNNLSDRFEDLSLSPCGGEVLDNSRMAASSDNARKAIESPAPSVAIEKQREFPFPASDDSKINLTAKDITIDEYPSPLVNEDAIATAPIKQAGAAPQVTVDAPSEPILRSPRLLLVDDNKINLNLLRMYISRRKYAGVKEAENGQEAVDAFRNAPEGFDVIFMDISMPVLDGFGATRQIRQIEHSRREKAHQEGKELRTPALIIALTGLASSRDQSEAFTSGIDLFLTKPVAFKEVGQMLDNWEANREREQATRDREEEKSIGLSIDEVQIQSQ